MKQNRFILCFLTLCWAIVAVSPGLALEISGVVRDVHGIGVKDARVRLRPVTGVSRTMEKITHADGSFRIERFSAGMYHVDVDHDRFLPWSDTRPLMAERDTPLEIILHSAEDEADIIPLIPAPDARLSGQVTDQKSVPVEAAVVIVGREFAVTDASGRFQFPRLPSGDRQLRVVAAGFETLSGWPRLQAGRQELTLKLHRQKKFATVLGRIKVRYRPKSREIPPLKVIFGDRVTTTDSRGGFRLESMPAGNHHVSILYSGRELWTDIVSVTQGDFAFEILLERLR